MSRRRNRGRHRVGQSTQRLVFKRPKTLKPWHFSSLIGNSAHSSLTFERLLRLEELEPRLVLSTTNVAITQAQEEILIDGLAGLSTWADGLDQHDLVSQLLPVVGQSSGDALDMGDIFDQGLAQPVADYFSGDPTDPTTDELVAAIQALNGATFDNVTLTVSNVSGGKSTASGDNELIFNLELQADRSLSIHPSLGPEGDALGIDLAPTINADASLIVDFSFGVDLTDGLTDEQAFFIRVNSFDTSVDASIGSLPTGAMSIGFLAATLTSGNMSLDANLSLALSNPDSDSQGNLTLEELQDTSLNSLVSLAETGSSSGSITAAPGSIGNFNPSGTPTVSFNSLDPFVAPTLTFNTDYDQVRSFTNISSFSYVGLLDQLGVWLSELGASSVLDANVQLASQGRIGDLVDLEGIIQDGLVAQLVDENQVPKFATAQSLATELENALGLSAATVNADYDPNSKELTYHLIVDHQFPSTAVPVGIDLDLSPLMGFSSGSSATLDSDGTLELTLGVTLDDLSAVMVATKPAPADGKTSATSNFNLNLGFGTDVPVTLTQAATADNTNRNDLVSDLNAAISTAGLGGSVVASLDGSNRLVLSTMTASQGLAAIELTAADFTPQGPPSTDPIVTELGFRGQHLAFDSLANHAFVENATIDGAASLSATDIDGTGTIGFLDVSVVDGTGTSTADFQLNVKDPTTQMAGGRVGLFDMFDALAVDVTTVVDAPTVNEELSVTLPLGAQILGTPVAGSPVMTVSWPDISTGSPAVQLADADAILKYQHLTGGDFGSALGDLAGFLSSVEGFSFLNQKIPGIDLTLGEIAGYADRFLNVVTTYDDDPAGALSELESTLEMAFGLDDSDLALSLVEGGDVLRVDVQLDDDYVVQEKVKVVDDYPIIDVTAQSVINVNLAVDFDLSFGIDLSNPNDLQSFLYESSKLDLSAGVNVQDIAFRTAVGPFGFFIDNGKFLIDQDNNPATHDSALASLTISDNDTQTTEGKIYLDDLGLDNAALSLTGQLNLTLPLFYPVNVSWYHQGNFEIHITDLSDIAGTTTIVLPDPDDEQQKLESTPLIDRVGSIVYWTDVVLGYIIDAHNGEVAGVELPFMGKDMQKAGAFLQKFRDEVVTELNNRLMEFQNDTGKVAQQAFFNALGPVRLDYLKDRNSDGMITVDDIAYTETDTDMDTEIDQVEFEMVMGQDLTPLATPIDFDIGLPGLNLDVTGNVELLVGFDWKLKIGISDAYGPYLVTDEPNEIAINFEARIPDLQGRGELGFLQVDVSDEDADNDPNNSGVDVDMDGLLPSSFVGQLLIDITDPVEDENDPLDDNKLTFDDIFFTTSVFHAFDFSLAGTADLNLDVGVSFEGDTQFPSILSELAVDWTFSTADSDITGSIPTVAFNNIQIDAGDVLTEFADGILKKVKEFTEPIQPVVDFVTSPIPVLSDFGFDLTPLEVAAALGYATEADYVEAVADIISAINSVPQIDGDLLIPLGSYTIVEPDGGGGVQPVDLRQEEDLSDADPNITETKDPVAELQSANAEAGGFFDSLKEMGIILPFIENPANVFRLLMGQQVDLFIYDVPALEVNFPFPVVKIGPLIPPIPIFASISGNIGAELDLAVGFDTYGVEKYKRTNDWFDVLAGFYISDRENPDGTGKDVPEATLSGKLNAGVEISLVVVDAGVSGGVSLNLYADLNDPDNDGKIHLDELLANIPLGVTGTFDLSGDVTASLDAYVSILFNRHEFTLAEFEISSFEFTDEDIFQDRFTNNSSNGSTTFATSMDGAPSNNTMGSATFIGAGPGLHLDGLSIESSGDQDWYEFELLKQDSIDVDVRHSSVFGDIDIEVYNSTGQKIAEGNSDLDREVASLLDIPAGNYFVRVVGSGTLNNYQLSVEPGETSKTRVFYVNPADADDRSQSYYTLAPGSDAYEGLFPRKPKATLQSVLDTYDLGPDDLVVFDTGTYASGGTILPADQGATYIGSLGGAVLSGVSLQDADANRFYRLDFGGAGTGLSLYASDNNRLELVDFVGPGNNVLIDDSDGNVFERNTFAGGGDGLRILGDGNDDSVGNVIRLSDFQNELTSLRIDSWAQNFVENNTFTGEGAIGIHLPSHVPAVLNANNISGRETGMLWESRITTVFDNDVQGNTVGIQSSTGVIGPDNPAPFGTQGGTTPNRVFGNETGILIPDNAAGVVVRFTDVNNNLVGIDAHGDQTQLIANDVHDNETGIRSNRLVGPPDWDAGLHNLIHSNDVGVELLAGGELQYNRVYENVVGVKVVGPSLVHNNLIYRNTGDGLLVSEATHVDVLNNTIYLSGGSGIHLEGFVAEILIRNNIVMAAGGVGLDVDAESQFGYDSDYNNYFATAGAVARQSGKTFADLYDWQVEAESDLNSLGVTSLHATLDDPVFVDLAKDDFHIVSSSTSIDAGDPLSDVSLEPSPNAGRVNLGAYGGTTQATTSQAQWLNINEPNFYVDLIPSFTYDIRWESYNLSSAVSLDIDLVEVGVGKIADITTVAVSAGSTTWTPGNFVTGDNAKRYSIRLTTLSGPTIVEESREPFAIPDFSPASATTFYVNDTSLTGDVFTSAAGNNRNTGLTANTPKAVMRPLVLSYPMGTGDEIRVDTGSYIHAVNLNLSSSPISFDPRMHTVSDIPIYGPSGGAATTTIDRGNPNVGSAAIDMIDSPNMTITDLSITGAGIGVRARQGSTDLIVTDVTLSDHGIDGLSIEGGSHDAELNRLQVFDNGRNGIFVDSRLTFLKNSAVHDNENIGVALRSVGSTVLETSEIYSNFRGIDVINPGPNQAVIGHSVLTSNLGNLVHDNAEDGVFASGNTLVTGNTVYQDGNIGIRLEDGADATFNVIRQHTTGISAIGSSSDITDNRSFINSDTGIEAGLASNVFRNATHNNDVYGIHAIEFSGVIDHNLVYSTGDVSINVEGPGVGAQLTHNTVYEPCASNDSIPHTGPTTVETEWDPTIFMEDVFDVPPPGGPIPPFSTPLWGDAQIVFQEATGSLGSVFNLGPGGGAGVQLPAALPPGETWTIDYEITSLELSSAMFPLIPMVGIVEASLSGTSPSTGQMVLENQGGVLVGSNTLNLNLEFYLSVPEITLIPDFGPMVINTTIDPSSGFGELDALQIPTRIPLVPTSPEAFLANQAEPADQWRWEMEMAEVSGEPDPPPQDRGDTCAEIGVLVQTQSSRVLMRNNAVWVEGRAALEPPMGNSIDVVVTADSTLRWDSDFNALMTDYGAVGAFAGVTAPTLGVWQGVTNDDYRSIDPPVGQAFIDPDGTDNLLGEFDYKDDNFHLISPFGEVIQGTISPIENGGPGNAGLPTFDSVVFQTLPGGNVNSLSPLVDAGDPASSYGLEPPENGQMANVGHYGNTVQSSVSEPEYVHLVYPLGAEQIVPGRTYDITWRSHDYLPGDTVKIELAHGGIGGSVETVIDPTAANTGSYSWTVSAGIPTNTDYYVVITRPSTLQPGQDIKGGSRVAFEIGADTRPPVVLTTTPGIVELSGATNAVVNSIDVQFSENLIGAASGASYELKHTGPNGVFDDGDQSDDVTFVVTPTYNAGSSDADTSSVDLAIVGGPLPEQDYRLTIFSNGITDLASQNLDGTFDGGSNNYVRFFSIDQTSPAVSIAAVVPDPRNVTVSPLTVVFDEPVQGLGLADVRLTLDGGPNLLSGTQGFTTTDGITWSLEDTSELTEAEGTYTFSLTAADSQIVDLAGNPLLVGASESWDMDTTPPSVEILDVTPDPRDTAVDQMTFVFSEPVANFGTGDVQLFRDGVQIALSGANAPTTSDNVTWTMNNLGSLTSTEGSYLLKVRTGATLRDGVGNGLVAEEREVWQMITSSPSVDIVDVSPDPRVDDVDEVIISFDRPITGLDLNDLTLTRGGNGVSLAGLLEPTSLDGMNWHLTGLSSLTHANGMYELTLNATGSGIVDQAGNALAVDASDSWLRDDVPPTVSITPIVPSPVNHSINSIEIVFTKPVTGLDLDNLILTHNTVVVNWTKAQQVSTTDGVTWNVTNLADLTSVDGSYSFALDPSDGDIQVFPGNPLLDGDSIAWTLDTIAPSVAFAIPAPSAAYDGLASVTFAFDEPVSGLDKSDLLLTRGGLEIPLTAAQTLTTSDNQTFTLGNLLTLNTVQGHYELSLLAKNSNVQDIAANLLPQGTFKRWRVLLRVDANQNDIVDGIDFLIWQRNFGITTGATPQDADSDADGDVDSDDLSDWQLGFGSTLPPTPVANGFDGSGYATFASLQTAYATFLGSTDNSVTFDGLSGVILPTQFTASRGVTFSNLGQIGASNEGSATIENLDGYDGSYQANGNTVYASYPNDGTAFTIDFATPVAAVGSFVAMGKEGTVNTLTINALDSSGAILKTLSVPTQVFADGQNREGFWAISTDVAAISRVTILNDSHVNFANTLILDTIEWSSTPLVVSAISATAEFSSLQIQPLIISQGGTDPDAARWAVHRRLISEHEISTQPSTPIKVFKEARHTEAATAKERLFAESIETLPLQDLPVLRYRPHVRNDLITSDQQEVIDEAFDALAENEWNRFFEDWK